jgi:ABC-type nickel/cobalt efflux system permease component RcnA
MPWAALAHPLGNFSISHYARLQIERQRIEIYYLLDMAELPTFQVLQEHGMVPEVGYPGVRQYLEQHTTFLQNGLRLEVNGQRLPLQRKAQEIRFPSGAGGLPTLKLGIVYHASLATIPATDVQRLFYQDTNFPGRAGWKEVLVVAGPGSIIVQSSVPTTDRSQALTNYPTDLLNSPPQVLEADVLFTRQAVAFASPADVPPHPLSLEANQHIMARNAFTELINPRQLSFGVVCLALAMAVGLGAVHALEPGHGKTVVAAYLVGSRGTAWHALYLGMIVTVTHTAGVYVLGGLALYASHYIVPERLYPWLGVLSGLMIASLGIVLFLQRCATPHYHRHPHDHDHPHTHAHVYASEHVHGEVHDHTHAHTPSPGLEPHHHHCAPARHHHHHAADAADSVTCRALLTLGMTGGMVPCPAALVVLLSAVSLHRIGFGLILIVAFSLGLATVLIAIGLLIVYTRQFMARFQSDSPLLTRWLPLTSAAAITLFGVAITGQALSQAGFMPRHLP